MDLAWEEIENPQIIDPRDALVRPIAVARCDLDPAIAMGLYPMPAPFVMGHEMVGEIVQVGESVSGFHAGDQVIVPFQLSCMTCPACLRGHTNACHLVPSGTAFGLGPHGGTDLGGALAELVRVPWADVMLIPLPAGIDPVTAAGIPDNVSDGYRCVANPLAERPGAPVLVVGGLAPSVGLYAVMSAIALGSEKVVYVDDDAGRNFALRSVEPCGVCTSVSGGASSNSSIPLQSMYLKGISYEVGRVHACATARPVLDLVKAGALDPARIINKVVPFSEAVDGMLLPVPKVVFINDFT